MAKPEKCKYCDKDSIIKVGMYSIPLCEDHFNKFIRGVALVVEKAKKVLSDNTKK